MKIKYPLLYVEWDDHHSYEGWVPEDKVINTPSACISVGWLYIEDDKGITLISSMGDEGQVSCTHYIIKSCITKRVVVRKGQIEKTKQ